MTSLRVVFGRLLPRFLKIRDTVFNHFCRWSPANLAKNEAQLSFIFRAFCPLGKQFALTRKVKQTARLRRFWNSSRFLAAAVP